MSNPTTLHLFGAATPSGESFRRLVDPLVHQYDLVFYSRRARAGCVGSHIADFENPFSFQPVGEQASSSIWISFGPIWLFAPFLEQLATRYPERLRGLRGLIACSSSSVLTKRFAANRFDRELVNRLIDAEDKLLAISSRLEIGCRILRPTLIYGQAGPYSDRNLSQLLRLMRRLPLLPLPAESGLRQPIHASQLASVALHLVAHLCEFGWDPSIPDRINIGGDVVMSYEMMIRSLQQAQPAADAAHCCRLVPIPNRLFFLLAAPLLLRSPKAFEAVLRMGANLSGFTPAHQLLGREAQLFPVLPLA